MPKPYYKNVAGDFYVEEGCCITCGVPMGEAPEFFEMDEDQCFIKRQPHSPAEIEKMVGALATQEVDCIRYKGVDISVVQRLIDAGEGEQIDERDLLTSRHAHVRLRVRLGCDLSLPSQLMARIFDIPRAGAYYTFGGMVDSGNICVLEFAWYDRMFQMVEIRYEGPGRFLVTLKPARVDLGPPLTRIFHGLLRALPGLSDVTWMTEDEFQRGTGQSAPY